MINLLPPATKTALIYARYNARLLTWAGAMGMGIAGIAVVVLAGQFYIVNSTKTYAAQVQASREQLSAEKLEETKRQVEDITSSLKLTTAVLSRGVLFSQLLQSIGSVMPSGVTLQNLSIAKVDGALDLQVQAVDYQTATQVQINLQDPRNKVFEKADIVSISCLQTGTKYPCQVSIRALFAKDSSFRFIPTKKASS